MTSAIIMSIVEKMALMSAFPDSGRSNHQDLEEINFRFRPEAVVWSDMKDMPKSVMSGRRAVVSFPIDRAARDSNLSFRFLAFHRRLPGIPAQRGRVFIPSTSGNQAFPLLRRWCSQMILASLSRAFLPETSKRRPDIPETTHATYRQTG